MSRTSARIMLIVTGLLLLLVPTILPLTLGAVAERAYQDLLRAALDGLPAGWSLAEHYDRGWFSSHATAELTPPPARARRPAAGPAVSATRVRLDSRIDQGPWSWFSTDPFPVAARVVTRIEWVDGPLALPPLLVDTTIGASGDARAHLLIPAADQSPTQPRIGQDYRLRNRAITGTLDVRPRPPQAWLGLSVPGIALSDPAGEVASLRDARLTADLTDWLGGPGTGHATLTIAGVRLGPGARLGTTGSDDRLERLTLTLEQTTKGQAPTLRLDLQLRATAELLRLDGVDYRAPVVGLSARSLDPRTVADLTTALRTWSAAGTSPAARGLVGATLLVQLVPRFLATGPSIDLNPVSLRTAEGPVSARLSLAVADHQGGGHGAVGALGALLGGGPTRWLGTLTGDGELTLPRPIALLWLGAADPTAKRSPADQLQAWIDGGWISARDGNLTSSLHLAGGRLSINGKPVPLRLPGLGG